MQQSGTHLRPASIDTNRRSTIMMQMMMATLGGTRAARGAQQQYALMARKAVGFAIVTSGFAVIAAQALQHALGG
jgi:hypothetical protein